MGIDVAGAARPRPSGGGPGPQGRQQDAIGLAQAGRADAAESSGSALTPSPPAARTRFTRVSVRLASSRISSSNGPAARAAVAAAGEAASQPASSRMVSVSASGVSEYASVATRSWRRCRDQVSMLAQSDLIASLIRSIPSTSHLAAGLQQPAQMRQVPQGFAVVAGVERDLAVEPGVVEPILPGGGLLEGLEDLVGRVRLGDVVVGPGAEALDPVLGGEPGGDHDHGDRAGRLPAS